MTHRRLLLITGPFTVDDDGEPPRPSSPPPDTLDFG